MRILVFANLPPYVLGGAENQVARLVSAWVRSGNHVEVAGHRIPTAEVFLENHRVMTHRIWTFDHAGRLGRAMTFFISTMLLLLRQRKRFDIIYCRGLSDAAICISVAKAARIIDLPLVTCPINAKGKGDANFIKSLPGWHWIVHLFNRHCNAINIIASAILGDLSSLNITVPTIASIPNGIPIQPPPPHKSLRHVKQLIFTGRLSHQKGLDLLIPALSSVKSKGFTFRLDIFGDGPLKNDLQQRINQWAVGDVIHLRGEVPADEIRNILVQYDAFVLPSRYEGMSNSALEAMEAGLPVLVTRCGGIDHYIDSRQGWVCEPEDLGSLIDAMISLLITPPDALANKGIAARALTRNNFNMDSIALMNLELMKAVITSASR